MEFNEIVSIIGNYAFPIVMCVALFWKMDKQDKEHKEEIENLTAALENNTLAIQHLADKMV